MPRTIERFVAKVQVNAVSGCWTWTAEISNSGYGRFWFERHKVLAHRWSYEHHVGPIPAELVIDHLCRNKRCVNPAHLEPVTMSENVIRGDGPRLRAAQCASITECPQGHAYSEDNTYRNGHGRTCRTCKRDSARASYERNRQAVIARSREWRLANPDRSRELVRAAQRRSRARVKVDA